MFTYFRKQWLIFSYLCLVVTGLQAETCTTNQCDYELNLEQGTYVSKITLDENGQAGVWGISILPPTESNLKIDTQGIGFGTNLQADGASPNWISFSITEPQSLSLTLFNYTDATQSIQANIQQLQQNEYVSIGQITLNSEQLTSTEPLVAGKYIISLQNTNAAYVGLLIQGNGLIYHSAGGWIEPNSDQVGFLYFNVLDAGQATLSNYFADEYDDLGASKPLLNFDYIPQPQASTLVTNANAGQIIFPTQFESTIDMLVTNPDDTLLAAVFKDGRVSIWNIESQTLYTTTQAFNNTDKEARINVQFSPDGNILLANNPFSQELKLWDVATQQEVAAFNSVYYFVPAFSPDGHLLAFYQSSKLIIWNTQTRSIQSEISSIDKNHLFDAYYRSPLLQFSTDNKMLVTQIENTRDDDTKGVYLWDTATGNQITKLTDTKPSALAISPDSQTLAIVFNNYLGGGYGLTSELTAISPSFVIFWDIATQTEINNVPTKQASILSAQFSPDGTQMITISSNGKSFIWDIAAQTTAPLVEMPSWFSKIDDYGFAMNEQFFFDNIPYTDVGLKLKLQDRLTKKLVATLEGEFAMDATFSSDGQRLIAALWDNTIRIWDTSKIAVVKQSFVDFLNFIDNVTFFDQSQIKSFDNGLIFDKNARQLLFDDNPYPFDTKWTAVDPWFITYDISNSSLNNKTSKTDINQIMPLKNQSFASSISGDGRLLVSVSDDNTLTLIDNDIQIGQLQTFSETINFTHLSKDKTLLAVVTSQNKSSNSTISFWDVATRTKLTEVQLDRHYLLPGLDLNDTRYVQFSPDNQLFFLNDRIGNTSILEVETGTELFQVSGGISTQPMLVVIPGSVSNAMFTPDSKYLVFSVSDTDSASSYVGRYQDGKYQVDSFDGLLASGNPFLEGSNNKTIMVNNPYRFPGDTTTTLRFWNIDTLTELAEKRINGQYIMHQGQIFLLKNDDIFHVWNAKTQTKITSFKGEYYRRYETEFIYLTYLSNNKSSDDCMLHVYDLVELREIIQIPDIFSECRSSLLSVKLSENKTKLILTYSNFPNYQEIVWDMETGEKIYQTDEHVSLSYSPDETILSHLQHNSLRLLDANSFESIPQFAQLNTVAAQIAPNRQTIVHPQQPLLAMMHSNLTTEGMHSWDGIKVWNTATGEGVNYKNPSKIYSVTWHPQQAILAYSDYAGQIHLWDVEADTETTLNHVFPAYFLSWSPDATMIAASGDNHLIYAWDTATGIERAKLVHDAPVRNLVWSPDGNVFASTAGTDIYVWDTVTGLQINRISAHIDDVKDIVFSKDSSIIISMSSGDELRFWHVETGTQIKAIQDQQTITAISTHPTQNILAYGTENGYVKLYDFEENQYVGYLKQYNDPVINIAFGHDADTLVVNVKGMTVPPSFGRETPVEKQLTQTWSLSEIIQ
ncbi:WD40 repeat domain-containing protein [Candidatus Albibeggiatoa sp. nov. NOAA]|uniref:WD40 repeat domain-containing protein n=1 Tax=Candidatus Albibeggiatoa sp. nov. NOAA TaxID=3162724 RepID=UPI0032FF5A14|nr:hypothetical protein [Thiotrichaceae bacterium]